MIKLLFVLVLYIVCFCGCASEIAETEKPNGLLNDRDGLGTCNNDEASIASLSDNAHVLQRIEELNRKIEILERALMRNNSIWNRGISYLRDVYRKAENAVVESLPPSDDKCFFNWKTFGCSPQCLCEWKPQFGDISLDRACRLRSGDTTSCDVNTKETSNIQLYAQKLMTVMNNSIGDVVGKVIENAPFSDDVCRWSFKKLSCVPSTLCELDIQLGDYSLNRACRLITDRKFSSDEIRSALLEN